MTEGALHWFVVRRRFKRNSSGYGAASYRAARAVVFDPEKTVKIAWRA
jgi:hypothetical protein